MAEDSSERVAAFVDTNVWLYAFIKTQDTQKNIVAHQTLVAINPVISVQVINETCVNLLKKAGISESDVKQLVKAFYAKYHVVNVGQDTLNQASDLRVRFSFSYWDSIIVASALQAGCTQLYTEDMQHGLLIDENLTLYNPFTDIPVTHNNS